MNKQLASISIAVFSLISALSILPAKADVDHVDENYVRANSKRGIAPDYLVFMNSKRGLSPHGDKHYIHVTTDSEGTIYLVYRRKIEYGISKNTVKLMFHKRTKKVNEVGFLSTDFSAIADCKHKHMVFTGAIGFDENEKIIFAQPFTQPHKPYPGSPHHQVVTKVCEILGMY